MDRNNLIIEKGDRIFARLSKNGRTILEFMINCIGSIDELMQEIRRMAGDVQGLVKLCLRNQSRGWGQERLLMLYADSRSVSASSLFGQSDFVRPAEESKPVATHRMLFPWETH